MGEEKKPTVVGEGDDQPHMNERFVITHEWCIGAVMKESVNG